LTPFTPDAGAGRRGQEGSEGQTGVVMSGLASVILSGRRRVRSSPGGQALGGDPARGGGRGEAGVGEGTRRGAAGVGRRAAGGEGGARAGAGKRVNLEGSAKSRVSQKPGRFMLPGTRS
jgi:hypothetical protein